MRYDSVIFDLDGTLLDTSEGIFRSVEYVIETLGFPAVSGSVMRTFIGPPMQDSFQRVYGLQKSEADRAADMFRNRYKEDDILLAKPYDGIYETIKELRDHGVKTAVATYKRQDYAEKILKHFGFDKICDAMCGADFEGRFKKKDIIENAIKILGTFDRSRVVMIGDSDNDAVGAAGIGADFIGVTYGFGFGSKEDVSEFENVGIADECKDILRFIL